MLHVEALSKRYGDIVALDAASFAVERGRMLGFLGPNGAGKTTSMRAILRLVDPDAGTVSWDGRPVDDPMRRRFGYMPEQRGLYPKMKIGDQVAWFGRLHGMTAPAAAAATAAWLERLALADRAGDPVETLSHGNQQRVQLATALVHDPDLLILDEPFSGLDPIGSKTMAGVLRERAAVGAAVLFSSHQLDVVEDLCDDVAIITPAGWCSMATCANSRRRRIAACCRSKWSATAAIYSNSSTVWCRARSTVTATAWW